MNQNIDLSFGPLNDLRNALPYLAGLLSKTAATGKVSDLVLISAENLPRRYMSDDACRDRLISKHGLTNIGSTLPFIATEQIDELEGKIPGWGISIYECRGSNVIRYAVFDTPNRHAWGDDFKCYVLLKDSEDKFRKHIRQQDAKANRITKPPILKEGMLEQIIDSTIGYLDRRDRIERFGVRIVRGVLLEGDPGNGKTMVCRWIRKLCIDKDISWGYVTAGTMENAHHNGGSLHELFNYATVMFFDDFDMEKLQGDMGRDIISALDGIEDTSHRVRIFTTNQKVNKEMDPAFFRPGRIDERFKFVKPDKTMRRRLVDHVWPHEIKEFINQHSRMKAFLEKSEGFSFADLEAIRKNMVFLYDVTGKWDQDEAFKRFVEHRLDDRRRVGF